MQGHGMQGHGARTAIGILIAMAFSTVYAMSYRLLVGGLAIRFEPNWPPAGAAAYVAGGIVLQAWFCYRRRTADTGWNLVAMQTLAGVGYLIGTSFFSTLIQT